MVFTESQYNFTLNFMHSPFLEFRACNICGAHLNHLEMGIWRTVGMVRQYGSLHLQNSISCPAEASNERKCSPSEGFLAAYVK